MNHSFTVEPNAFGGWRLRLMEGDTEVGGGAFLPNEYDEAVEYGQSWLFSFADQSDFDPRNREPDCTCTRVDVDLYDARGCELCDPRSDWNRECAALNYRDSLRRSEVFDAFVGHVESEYPRRLTDEDCSF